MDDDLSFENSSLSVSAMNCFSKLRILFISIRLPLCLFIILEGYLRRHTVYYIKSYFSEINNHVIFEN